MSRRKRHSPNRAVNLINGLLLLADGKTFTSEESLVAFEVTHLTIEYTGIRGNNVTIAEKDGVSGDNLLDGDDFSDWLVGTFGVTDDSRLWCSDRL